MQSSITQYLEDISHHKVNPSALNSLKKIMKEHVRIKHDIMQNNIRIYGVTTQVGHMDDKDLSNDLREMFQKHLIENHHLVVNDEYDRYITKSILYAKIMQLSQGFSGISIEMYERLLKIMKDENYHITIPKSSSYSCGDVIPGAAFAKSVLNYSYGDNYKIKYKDGMTLLNGSYISTGHALALTGPLRKLIDQFLSNTIHLFSFAEYDTSMMNPIFYPQNEIMVKICSFFHKRLPYRKTTIQEPISIRSTPQVVEAALTSLNSLEKQIDILIKNPSDNPFVVKGQSVSQSSFFSPALTLELEKTKNMLLYLAWIIERRVHHLISGKVKNIPINGVSDSQGIDLGAIQIPKLCTHTLELLRMENGRSIFASGSSTSYGIEDNWTFSLSLAEAVSRMIFKLKGLLTIESELFEYIKSQNYSRFKKRIEGIYKEENHNYNDMWNYKAEDAHPQLNEIFNQEK